MHIVKVVASFILPDRGGGGGRGTFQQQGGKCYTPKQLDCFTASK